MNGGTGDGQGSPPEPAPAAVDVAVAEIDRRFKDALEMETTLNQLAMSREELRRYLRDSLRLGRLLLAGHEVSL